MGMRSALVAAVATAGAALAAFVPLLGSQPAGVSAACAYPILSLEQIARQAPVVVVADVLRERLDGPASFASTLAIRATLKGEPPGPVVSLTGLGHVDTTCDGGPRLLRGGRYVLFLSRAGEGPSTVWSLVDAEGGVYQIGPAGTRFPPEHAGGPPQTMPVPAAELVRDVGDVAAIDAAKIENVVSALALPETVEAPPAPATSRPFYEQVPRRETTIAIAAAAILVASLLYLLWRPRDTLGNR